MGRSLKSLVILFILIGFVATSVMGQNYRDQKKLIRLKPNHSLVFGQIQYPSGDHVTGASISLFDPAAAQIVETIPVDDLGEYLFILEKGKLFGFIIEKDGFFPYYTEFVVPADGKEEWINEIKLPEGLKKHYTLSFTNRDLDTPAGEAIEEITGNLKKFNDLKIWIPEKPHPLFTELAENLMEKIVSQGIEPHRIFIGDQPANPDQFIQLHLFIENSTTDSEILENTEAIEEKESTETGKWTLQFLASKKEVLPADLKGVDNYKVFEGRDGFYRYTYGLFNSKEEAESGRSYLNTKGFNQAIAKKIEDLNKL